jgi:hypothetical protein
MNLARTICLSGARCSTRPCASAGFAVLTPTFFRSCFRPISADFAEGHTASLPRPSKSKHQSSAHSTQLVSNNNHTHRPNRPRGKRVGQNLDAAIHPGYRIVPRPMVSHIMNRSGAPTARVLLPGVACSCAIPFVARHGVRAAYTSANPSSVLGCVLLRSGRLIPRPTGCFPGVVRALSPPPTFMCVWSALYTPPHSYTASMVTQSSSDCPQYFTR